MKKFAAFLLVICLVLGLSVSALAASGPKIAKQPESATTDEKGTVAFRVSASGFKGLTWRFVNPATGEETPGKKLNSLFKKIKISGVNGVTITLKNVPEEMHGWYVYCHLTGNGYELDSEKVRLLVYGLPDPDESRPSTPETDTAPDVPDGDSTIAEPLPADDETITEPLPADDETITEPLPADDETITEPLPDDALTASDNPRPSDESAPADPQPEPMHIDENGNLVPGAAEEKNMITIRAKDATLYPIDSYGKLVTDEAAEEMTFEESADLAVRAEGEIRYWMLNGIRLEPMESVTGFILRNVTSDLTITAVPAVRSAQAVDETKLVTVTCEGCKFTWGKGGLKNVTSGQVPAGSEILIMSNPAPESGYSLNGGAFEDAGKMSVRRIVTEDTVITAE